ncbi:MAG: THxN family PEP-CTERM protein [Phenylobacterium sp.]|uniref:THxN family PEP-CTERM protein n=1 Tax=Phenylobacterium sp. TaxID=1871053 RepID=UPI002726C48C|nr:THxN family PEP-CTERM protein [Phenylobacterium sp.]MDO9429689.1 THxN family PEP-CTERM protein [Phenylobacterium sp.]
MQLKFKALAAGVALATAALASSASAGTVVISNVQGAWSIASPTGTIANGNPVSTVKWGQGTQDGGNRQSSYVFTAANAPFQADLSDGDTGGPFKLGSFQHNNWPVTGATLQSVKLTVSAVVTIDGNDIGLQNFVYNFVHVETPNEGGYKGACQFGGKSGDSANLYGCSDKVMVNTISYNNSFTYGLDTYTLDIAGFLVGNTLTSDFLTKESAVVQEPCPTKWDKHKKCKVTKEFNNKADIMASVSMVSSAVPEPATWAMMIIGFGAVGTMVRTSRRRNTLAA